MNSHTREKVSNGNLKAKSGTVNHWEKWDDKDEEKLDGSKKLLLGGLVESGKVSSGELSTDSKLGGLDHEKL